MKRGEFFRINRIEKALQMCYLFKEIIDSFKLKLILMLTTLIQNRIKFLIFFYRIIFHNIV
jgi:hypothetical protein